MSRQYNPAVSAYRRMNLDDFNKLEQPKEPKKTGGLLVRSSMGEPSGDGIDYKILQLEWQSKCKLFVNIGMK